MEDTQTYDATNLIILIESYLQRICLQDRLKYAERNGERFILSQTNVEKTISSSSTTPSFLMVKHVYGGVIEDNSSYTYPLKFMKFIWL